MIQLVRAQSDELDSCVTLTRAAGYSGRDKASIVTVLSVAQKGLRQLRIIIDNIQIVRCSDDREVVVFVEQSCQGEREVAAALRSGSPGLCKHTPTLRLWKTCIKCHEFTGNRTSNLDTFKFYFSCSKSN